MHDAWHKKSIEELVHLTEAEATRAYFDSRNARVLFRLLVALTVWAVFEAIFWLNEGTPAQALRPLLTLILIRGLYLARRRPSFKARFRPLFLTYFSLQLLLLKVIDLSPGASFHLRDFVLPFLLLFFRLPRAQLAIPLGVLWASSAGRNVVAAGLGVADLELGKILGLLIVSSIVLFWVGRLSDKQQRDFLLVWRREHRRHREQNRMRGELDDARKIQLSMLPQREPNLTWLDPAGISIPASEVGGDFYDYFEVSPSQQAVVIADVAGHGVASGMALSGIRSCLYLLHETPTAPVEILTRLDRMVRLTTGTRFFVTMFYVVFDRDAKELTYAAAGHPPLLHYRAEAHEVDEIGLDSLPLGTALESSWHQQTVPFASDDIFLLYTDGIAETFDRLDQPYGYERLRRRLRDTAHDRTAKEIRDTLLGDVWNFKGDSEQTDDITVVVIKVR